MRNLEMCSGDDYKKRNRFNFHERQFPEQERSNLKSSNIIESVGIVLDEGKIVGRDFGSSFCFNAWDPF